MSFKSEVREFMRKAQEHFASESAAINVLNSVIKRQAQEINDLHDKLLARNLPELKTYTLVDFNEREQVPYSHLKDEALAGAVGDFGKDT